LKKNKKNRSTSIQAVDINVMPFIDVFSLLCTFLLFSSVFITIGVHTVQIPFFSNATETKEKQKREHILLVDVSTNFLEFTSEWSLSPVAKEKHRFVNSSSGIQEFHKKLIEIKEKNLESQKIKLFFDDKIKYESVTKILDSVVLLQKNEEASPELLKIGKLFPQVVLGNVIL